MWDLSRQGTYVWRGVVLAVVLGMAYLFWTDNRGRIRERLKAVPHKPWLVLFLLYAGFLLVSTLFGRSFTVPYKNLTNHLFFGNLMSVNIEITENILLYIPYVFLMLQAVRPKHSLRKALGFAAGTSVFVELSQLLFWLGECQLADVLHNTAGGLLGWGLYALGRLLFHHRGRKQADGEADR